MRPSFVGRTSLFLYTNIKFIRFQVFINIPDAIYPEKSPQKCIVHHTLYHTRSALQATLIDYLLQIRCETVRFDFWKQITTDFAMRQYIYKLLQPKSLFTFEGRAIFLVRVDVQQQRFP